VLHDRIFFLDRQGKAISPRMGAFEYVARESRFAQAASPAKVKGYEQLLAGMHSVSESRQQLSESRQQLSESYREYFGECGCGRDQLLKLYDLKDARGDAATPLDAVMATLKVRSGEGPLHPIAWHVKRLQVDDIHNPWRAFEEARLFQRCHAETGVAPRLPPNFFFVWFERMQLHAVLLSERHTPLLEDVPLLTLVQNRPEERERFEEKLRELLETLLRHEIYCIDIKPANVVVSKTRRLFLIDFGLPFCCDDAVPPFELAHTPCQNAAVIGDATGGVEPWIFLQCFIFSLRYYFETQGSAKLFASSLLPTFNYHSTRIADIVLQVQQVWHILSWYLQELRSMQLALTHYPSTDSLLVWQTQPEPPSTPASRRPDRTRRYAEKKHPAMVTYLRNIVEAFLEHEYIGPDDAEAQDDTP